MNRHRACVASRLVLLAAACTALPARAAEPFVYMTNWFAEAEHGGFYQAIATGLYKKAGLDVTLKMGGPQVNIVQLMAAGRADCVMGASDLQMLQLRESGVPVVTVAVIMQKDPQVIVAHADVTRLEQLKGKTVLLSPAALQGYWPWLKAKYGLVDAQTRPYTFNVQPFVADKNAVQQGYVTSEPYSVQKAGVKANTLLLSDFGYPAYSTTISCMEATLKMRRAAVAAFVKASLEGWKSYLENPAPGNVLIKKDNPEMTDDQLAYSVATMKSHGIVASGDALTQGIGTMTATRWQASYDFMVASKLLDPKKVDVARAYTLDFVKDLKVLP